MRQKLLALSVRSALLAVMGAALGMCYTSAQAETTSATSWQQPSTAMDSTTSPASRSELGDQKQSYKKATATDNNNQQPTKLKGVVVTGTLGSLIRAEATKRHSVGVVDSISADEAGKFPDQTVATALQRIPGVSVNRSGGNPNQVTVRGFGPGFVNVLLNGHRVASATFSRAFNLEVMPVELLHQAVVHKTGKANLPVGGIGATINIKTWQPLDFNRFHATARVAASRSVIPGEKSSEQVTPKVSTLFGDTNSDGSFGWLVGATYYKRDHATHEITDSGWLHVVLPRVDPTHKYYMPRTLQGNSVKETQTRRSLIGAIEWRPVKNFTVRANALFAEFKTNPVSNNTAWFTNPGSLESITADKHDTVLTAHTTAPASTRRTTSRRVSRATRRPRSSHCT